MVKGCSVRVKRFESRETDYLHSFRARRARLKYIRWSPVRKLTFSFRIPKLAKDTNGWIMANQTYPYTGPSVEAFEGQWPRKRFLV